MAYNPPEFYREGVKYRFRWKTKKQLATYVAFFDSWEISEGLLFLVFTRDPDDTTHIVATALCHELSEVEEVIRVGIFGA